jgi:FtsP/CotA-like multicopper oxidase with cupredoxin domain
VTKERVRLLVACVASLAIIAPLAWLWNASRMPDEYSVMDMGYLDYGGGPRGEGPAMAGHEMAGMPMGDGAEGGTAVSVADLVTDPDRPADVRVDLVARKETFTLASGREVAGYTLNGRSPGPLIEATQGQLLEVHLTNESVSEGVTLHWHGVDVPNAEDGVAGVTQDAVAEGDDHVYRFVAEQAGSFWYHSHQVSHEQVQGGLLGPLVILPRGGDTTRDVLGLSHLYDGAQTLNGEEGDVPVQARPGDTVRVRVLNTDNGPVKVWSGTPYRLVAVDGTDVHEPGEVDGQSVTVTAGGRADLELVVPDGGARVQVGASTALVLGPEGVDVPEVAQPDEDLDLLHYGTPAPIGFDPAAADRDFEYSIGRRPGFVDGRPGLWWSVNGHLFPDVPMFVVSEGDVVRVTIENHSGDVHPMHLHGHHAVVLSRDGEPATGSPWWFDSLNVLDDETFEIAFLADNPGVWMDHCHNLNHAAEGLVTHLMYAGVTEPYRVGGVAENEPE